jgi:hypothetical protein
MHLVAPNQHGQMWRIRVAKDDGAGVAIHWAECTDEPVVSWAVTNSPPVSMFPHQGKSSAPVHESR